MRPFNLEKGQSVKDILRLKNDDSTFIAGGTNVLDLMKKHITQPDTLIDVNAAISSGISQVKNRTIIGANVKNASLTTNQTILHYHPLLSKAVLAGASQQIRNMATTAGNLMQRTRCVYFYDHTTPCSKRDKNSSCSAINGENRMSAIVGYNQNCVATHPSDLCIALAALDAKVYASSSTKNKIEIPFKDFHKLPKNTPWLDNNLPKDAVITHVEIEENKFNKNYAYIKLRDRTSYAFALVSVAVAIELDGNIIKDIRLASGGVAHKPWRWYETEKFLKGKAATKVNFIEAAKLTTKDIKPLTHNAYKIDLLEGAIVVALEEALNPNH